MPAGVIPSSDAINPLKQTTPGIVYALSFIILAGGLIGLPAYGWKPVVVFAAALMGTLLLFVAFGIQITGAASGFLRTSQNTYSLSRLQMAGWTWLIVSALLALAVNRLWIGANSAEALNIYIPGDLFAVMGISFFTGAAAPALLSLKSATQPTLGQLATMQSRMQETDVTTNGQIVVRPLSASARFGDIVEGDDVATAGTVDLSKVQQLLITALLQGVYFAMLLSLFTSKTIFGLTSPVRDAMIASGSLTCITIDATCGNTWSAMPDFPVSLVTLLLISHGGYLAYKAAPRSAADGT